MKNNSIGTVAVSNTKRPRARFNFSSDLHTSMDFGSVIPGRVQMMVPNSKIVASSHEKIWCAPLLAPTMGRLSLKCYHNFVRMSDLIENFSPMLSQESVSRGNSQFVPQFVPKISVSDLSYFILAGSSVQFYKRDTAGGQTNTDDVVSQWTNSIYSGSGANITSDADLSALGLLNPTSFSTFAGVSVYAFDPALVIAGTTFNVPHPLPLSNPRNNTFYPLDPSTSYVQSLSKVYDTSDITPDNADVVLPVTLEPSGSLYYLCFRLSDFGKRLRKILIGCGYEINFSSTAEVSVLPLLAFYKSYFDVFGLTLYQNWEQSYAYRFLRSADLQASPEVSSSSSSFWTSQTWTPVQDSFKSFFYKFMLLELSYSYYTDEQDFVSSHTTRSGVSPSPASFVNSVNTDVDPGNSYNPNIIASTIGSAENSNFPSSLNGHAYISDVLHGQLDSELLKRLYRWTNRNTIAGRRIAELLRAQGLGSYVDECKSDFIGSFEVPVSIYDGISQSDTFSQVTDSGASLGERFGSGEADSSRVADAERPFTFECNEFGYWITLFTIVPKGGYAEAFDPTVFAKSKFEFYNPEFDSLGMEFSKKLLVHGSQPFADFTENAGSLDASFGLVPRYFAWKFGRNVANGDFTRRSVRSSFSAYYLDKVLDVGNRRVEDGGSNSTNKRYVVTKLFTPFDLPVAGNVWRYPTRYSFIGQFNRIFNYQGRIAAYSVGYSNPLQIRHELFDVSEDNFILHVIYDVQYFAPMLPVEDSFETYDDDNGVNGSMSKA